MGTSTDRGVVVVGGMIVVFEGQNLLWPAWFEMESLFCLLEHIRKF